MPNNKTVVCFGAGPAFKGGMSNYNTSLAKSLDAIKHVQVHIVSWLHQYPSIVPREFKDKVSQVNFLEGTDISCKYLLNYNNPISYGKTAQYIASLNPDQVIIQWSIAIQGLPIGKMVRKLKQICNCEVILDLHFVIQKEESKIDRQFTKYGLSAADTFIVHALKTYEELQAVFPKRKFDLTYDGARSKKTAGATPVIKLFHPIYDLYQPDPNFDVAQFKQEVGLKEHVFLYFGFIRRYKGLHNAIKAFDLVRKQRDDVSFLVCGELFWNTLAPNNFVTKVKELTFGLAKKLLLGNKEDEKSYNPLTLVDELKLQDTVKVFSSFIPNEDVHKYFMSADSVILFYSTATPSGIESLSYNFSLPVLATKVGHFPETIQDGKNGYMTKENTVEAMAETMLRSIEEPIPGSNVDDFKSNLSWETYSNAILNVS